jgi:hypothetical protein
MERRNKFFGLGMTLAAGALALAMVPGSALAMASYDVSAFADLYIEGLPDGVTSSSAGDPTVSTSISLTGQHATAEFNPDPPQVVVFDDEVFLNIGVSGSANSTGADPYGYSFASVDTQSNLLLENELAEEQGVQISLGYSASWALVLGRPMETASAMIEIILSEVGVLDPLYSILIDPIIPDLNGQWPAIGGTGDQLIEGLLVLVPAADEFGAGVLGLQLTVNVLGSAESEHKADPEVPLPATLALLGIGLIGFASRKRFAAARD